MKETLIKTNKIVSNNSPCFIYFAKALTGAMFEDRGPGKTFVTTLT